MNTFAYCSLSFRHFVRRAAGVASPTTCPPTTVETFDPSLLADRDFVWLKLHGRRREPYWYGDNHTTALSAPQLAQADLEGAVVFVSNCWLADDTGQPGPMLLALAQARPKAIIGGTGENYALAHRLGATDLLGLYVRVFLQIGFATFNALRLAKLRLRLKRPDRVTEDTLAFRLWTPLELLGPDAPPPQGEGKGVRGDSDARTFWSGPKTRGREMTVSAPPECSTFATRPADSGPATLGQNLPRFHRRRSSMPVLILAEDPSDNIIPVQVDEDGTLQIVSRDDVFEATLTLDTNAYADGDVLADTQELDGAAFTENGGKAIVESVQVLDKDDQGADLDIVLLRASTSLGTENSAVSISDANAADVLGVISITSSDYDDFVGCQVAHVENVGMLIKAASDDDGLYIAAIARGSATYTASGLVVRVGLLR